MSKFNPKDRVSINKDLTYTAPRFGVAEEMNSIFTGTVTHNLYCNDNEVTVMLDYPDDVPEYDRIGYSYDPRDLTLISRTFKPNDKVLINKDLPYTTPRFGSSKDMREFSTGVVVYVDENDVVDGAVATRIHLDTDKITPDYFYDPRDLTLITDEPKTEKKGNPMSKFNKDDKIVIDRTLKFTKKRFGITDEMRTIFTGVVKHVIEKENKVIINLDGSNWGWTYDLRDISLASESNPTIPIPTNVKTSSNTTTVEFSDSTTTSVTKSADDPYDLETAIAYCIAKKLVTNSCIKHLAKNAEEVENKVTTDFYNKFLKPYEFLNENAYTDVEIETLKNYLKTLNDVRADLALVAIENDLTKDELFNKLKG